MRLREDLAEVRHPLAENSVAALQLFNALPSLLTLSVDDIVEAVHPPVEISVGALPLLAALGFIEELLVELRDDMPLVRALGLEQRVLAGLRSMSQGGRWAIRAAARQGVSASTHAAGFSRSHTCTHRKAAEEVISLSSCEASLYTQRFPTATILQLQTQQSSSAQETTLSCEEFQVQNCSCSHGAAT